MSDDPLSDHDAKEIMRAWPRTTRVLFEGTDEHPWIRAQPKNETDTATTPYLLVAGAPALRTQPDGMFVRPIDNGRCLDVVCFEVCSNLTNLQDKRSRYTPTTASLVVETRAAWWNEAVQKSVTRWQKAYPFGGPDENGQEEADTDDWYPIRYLRTVYVLRRDDLDKFRENGVASGHEYFIRNSSLGSITSRRFQHFLKRLAPSHHFYTK